MNFAADEQPSSSPPELDQKLARLEVLERLYALEHDKRLAAEAQLEEMTASAPKNGAARAE